MDTDAVVFFMRAWDFFVGGSWSVFSPSESDSELELYGEGERGRFLILFLSLLVEPKCGGSHIFEKISAILLMFELMPSNVACKSKVSGGEDCLFGKLSVCSAPGGFESDSLPGGLPSISSMSSVSIGLAAICATWFHRVGSKIEKSLYLQLGS